MKGYLSTSKWRGRRLPGEAILGLPQRTHPPWFFKDSFQREPASQRDTIAGPVVLLSLCLKHTEGLRDSRSPCIAPGKMNTFISRLCLLTQFWVCCSGHHDRSFLFFSFFLFFFLPFFKLRTVLFFYLVAGVGWNAFEN